MLPDWYGLNNTDGIWSSEAKESFDARSENAMKGTPWAGGKRCTLAQKYLANKCSVCAWDSSIRDTLGVSGLRHFLGAGVGALKPGATRHRVEPDDLPEALVQSLGERSFRSAIEREDGEIDWEVDWRATRPSIWSFIDQGSVGQPSKHVTFYTLGVRGDWTWDPMHRRMNNNRLALKAAGIEFIVAEFRVVLAYIWGPFHSQGNFQKIRQQFLEYHKNNTYKDHSYRGKEREHESNLRAQRVTNKPAALPSSVVSREKPINFFQFSS